jgi:hypothetical protein
MVKEIRNNGKSLTPEIGLLQLIVDLKPAYWSPLKVDDYGEMVKISRGKSIVLKIGFSLMLGPSYIRTKEPSYCLIYLSPLRR